MKRSDFYYNLPPERIAQTPAEPRDSSRLLVYDRAAGKTEHRFFRDLPDYLKPGDLMVRNNTRVMNMRFDGNKTTGGKVELLLLKRRDLTTWETLAKPGKNALPGTKLEFYPLPVPCSLIPDTCKTSLSTLSANFAIALMPSSFHGPPSM